jgi:hypothetical protein
MTLPIEAIVGILGMIIGLPPTIYAIWKMIHHFRKNSVNEGAFPHNLKLWVPAHTDEHDIEHKLESQEIIHQHTTYVNRPETATCPTLTINIAHQNTSLGAVRSDEARIHSTPENPVTAKSIDNSGKTTTSCTAQNTESIY